MTQTDHARRGVRSLVSVLLATVLAATALAAGGNLAALAGEQVPALWGGQGHTAGELRLQVAPHRCPLLVGPAGASHIQLPAVQGRLFGTQRERKRWVRHNLWNRSPPLLRPFLYFFYRSVAGERDIAINDNKGHQFQ